jgi:hypothetical protein
MLDTYPARGARSWEQTQIYAPYLLVHNDVVYDFYNANSGQSEQTGYAVQMPFLFVFSRLWSR